MGAILAIDYGEKRIGLAISDEDKKFAMPLKVIEVTSDSEAVAKVSEIIEKYNIEKLIIGNPLNSNFEETEISDKVNSFLKLLNSVRNIPSEKINEFLSSKYAKNSFENIKYKVKYIDSEVARNLLQDYLNSKNNSNEQNY